MAFDKIFSSNPQVVDVFLVREHHYYASPLLVEGFYALQKLDSQQFFLNLM